MPLAPQRPCLQPGCSQLTRDTRCPKHQEQHRAQDVELRGTAADRGYDSHWRRLRNAFIKRNPFCVHCYAKGMVTQATVVDHVTPHRGDPALRLDWENLQSLCTSCHARKTKQEGPGYRA